MPIKESLSEYQQVKGMMAKLDAMSAAVDADFADQ
jgi:hypothetical protein